MPRVREVWVFGSYARGALEVGDVDLAVEFDQSKDEAGRWLATLVAGGFDHLGELRRELRGNQRALEIHFNELEDPRKGGFEPQLFLPRPRREKSSRPVRHESAVATKQSPSQEPQ